MSQRRHVRGGPVASHLRKGFRRLISPFVLLVLGFILASAGAAYGYWTVSGTGSATATAASLSAPTSPNPTVNGGQAITVGWTLPGSQLTGAQYQVTRKAGPGSPVTICTVSSSTSSCQDTGLSPNTAYGYSIIAVLDNWQTAAITTSATTATDAYTLSLSNAPYTAGTAITVQSITAKVGGVQDTTYKGTKTITWSGLANSPSGQAPTYPSSSVSFTNGVATLGTPTSNFTAFDAGNNTLIATDASATVVTGSTTFTLNPAVHAKLAFTTQPASGANLQATGTGSFPVSVEVLDSFGNIETGDISTTVNLAIGTNPSSGALSCTNTNGIGPVTVSGGIANFTGCSITKVGTGYTLTASSTPTNTAPTNANSFNIIAGTAAGIALANITANTTPVVSCSGSVGSITCSSVGEANTSGNVLTAKLVSEDQNGNAVTNTGATIGIDLSTSGSGSVSPSGSSVLSILNGSSTTSASFTLTRSTGNGKTVILTATVHGTLQKITITLAS